MLHIIKERIHQQYRTQPYPRTMPVLPPRYMGTPTIAPSSCGTCRACVAVCPTGALRIQPHGPMLDMGRCIFCGACQTACTAGTITFTNEHRMAAFCREDLFITGTTQSFTLPQRDYSLFARSLKLREVSAGGCNACEADTNVLGTLTYDLGRFGIEFAASPRHADGLLVTGPVTTNMREALLRTYDAVPEPRVVVAVGTCAITGGLFAQSPECNVRLDELMPVDIYIPGCPPNPWSILDGLLLLTGRISRSAPIAEKG